MQPVRRNRAGILTAVGTDQQARQIQRRIGRAVPDTIIAAGGNARAARGECLTGTLVDRYVPADLTKEQPGEQTADRSANDDRAFSLTSG
jgi:hypothetical protein